MQLEEFLQNASKRKFIRNITTSSKHKKIILDSLNSLLTEHPEWETTLFSLAEYSKQKWAIDQNFIISEDKEIFKAGYHYSSAEMAQKYSFTKSIVEHIQEIIEDEFFRLKTFKEQSEYDAFEAAHELGAEDVSKYIMTAYYKKAIISFCEAHNKKILSLLKDIKTQYKLLESDEALIYHDTDTLIKTVRYVIKKNRYLDEIDNDNLVSLIKKCINTIEAFPYDGHTMKNILYSYTIDTKSDQKIGAELFASETFVRNKRKQAIELISLLLWGYSSRIILRNM